MKTNYKLSGTPNSPVIVLSNSLGATYQMWDELVPFLLPYFRVLQYDTRGHGESDKPDQPYTLDMLGQDVLELLDHLQVEKAYFCGVSMGGLIGQWLAIHASDRFHKICISNTAAKIGTKESWNERIATIQNDGFTGLAEITMAKWFSPTFHQQNRSRLESLKTMFTANDVKGYGNCCHAIGAADFREKLENISLEVLVIAGDEDPVTTVEQSEFLVANLPNSRLAILPGRHLVNVEIPQSYANTLIDFFIGSSKHDRGMHVRETVLGSEHLSRVKGNANSFTSDFQEMIAEIPWGSVWTRPGLNKHQRSLITLSAMIAMDKQEEFKMHVRAAFNNGVTLEELKELILQSAIYCGFPAANTAYRIAEEVLKELKIDY